MHFGSAHHELPAGLKGGWHGKNSLADVSSRLRISRYDLSSSVVVSFRKISVINAPEIGSISLPLDGIPVVLPAVPGPGLCFGWGVGAVIVQPDAFRRAEPEGASGVMIRGNRDNDRALRRHDASANGG
jgi:hypothetical protein